ncbi:hypothetical protein C8A00DRAFT_31595 [Chaetomidium leptoderma]|uniref:Uncharacterized protein n=1 Tax=Chaetomidium leptoderma TaxID=669021 RepID=A0AAN6VSD0_9PEZI|nr:hypothetical protein C8A00DRAFT_31595 [Chaetomidium leptoderma]
MSDVGTILPPAADDAHVTIPDVLISPETLVYVGLSSSKSAEVWDRWANWPPHGPGRETDADDGGLQVSFIDFIIGHIRNEPDAADESDAQWRACLQACGIANDMQDAIMDPHFRYLRLSHSCLYWIRDTVEMRYAELQEIQRKSEHGRPVSGLQQQQQQSMAGTAPKIWSVERANATAARDAPGYTVLYKAVDQARIAYFFDEAGVLKNINALESRPPSDFSRNRCMFYFTPDVRVAEYSAGYAKRRSGGGSGSSIVIFCLRIPNAAIDSLAEPDIRRLHWPSDDWKELVWYSRTQQWPLPSHLRPYRDALLIIGTKARKSHAAYRAMGSWEEVTEDCVLKVGARGELEEATQYVISGEDEGGEWLEENGDMRMYLYTRSDLDTWLTENPASR